MDSFLLTVNFSDCDVSVGSEDSLDLDSSLSEGLRFSVCEVSVPEGSVSSAITATGAVNTDRDIKAANKTDVNFFLSNFVTSHFLIAIIQFY